MSILIKESQEASGNAEILYNNPLVQGYRNYLNELYIIRSYPLVQDVVDELGFTTSFYKSGNVKTTEVYKAIPVKISFVKKDVNTSILEFKILSDSKFELAPSKGDDVFEERQVFSFNDTIDYQLNRFVLSKISNMKINEHIDASYILKLNSSFDIAQRYINRLKIEWAEEGASVVNLDMNGALPEKEIDFLNTLVEMYRKRDLDKKRQTAARSLEFIEEQLANISDSLLWYEAQLENFKKNNDVVNISGQAEKVLLRIEDLDRQLSTVSVFNRYLTYLKKHINEQDKVDHVVLPVSVGVNDPVLIALVNKMVEMQLQIGSYANAQQTDNPYVLQMKSSLANVKNSISESITNIEVTNKIQTEEINKTIEKYERELAKLPSAERKLITIQRNYKFSESLYTFLTQKSAEAGITKASETSDIS
jgi:uncharacterized protein involved in exopolysaccharide biosynthesis